MSNRNLTALLCHGRVLKDYFMELPMKNQENTRDVFFNRHATSKVPFTTFKMMYSYIPLEESYLQHRLSFLKKEENTSLKKGKKF
ncbi:hypothetical protein DVH24_007028 [Malus domestica]|uniref:Uncharacterized protein n=1 Tax=Malus domestica TaxID=3750 RepID=A0A498HIQ5_MALDO|nr:hypothetical protein DVH24_007028 [Malus domestica]